MHSSIWFALVVLFIEIVAVGILTPNDWLRDSIHEERILVSDWLGEESTDSLITDTNDVYKYLFVDTNIIIGSYKIIPTKNDREKSKGIETLGSTIFPYVKERIDVMWSAIYQSIQRMSLFMMWVPYMLPLFIPAFIDGMSVRNVKKFTYGYASPVRYHTAYHFIVILLAAIPFYLAIPVSVTPLVVPLWAGLFSASVMLMMTNLQKKI